MRIQRTPTRSLSYSPVAMFPVTRMVVISPLVSAMGFISPLPNISLGTIVPGYENITSTPKLEVISGSEWVTAMDAVLVNQTSYQGQSK